MYVDCMVDVCRLAHFRDKMKTNRFPLSVKKAGATVTETDGGCDGWLGAPHRSTALLSPIFAPVTRPEIGSTA